MSDVPAEDTTFDRDADEARLREIEAVLASVEAELADLDAAPASSEEPA